MPDQKEILASQRQGSLGSDAYSFFIIKPDALDLGIDDVIKKRIRDANLAVVALQTSVSLQVPDVLTIWTIQNPHVSRTVPYMMSRAVDMGVVSGDDASQRMLTIKRDLRAQYPHPNPVVTVVHTTNEDEELNRCVDYFFPELEATS